MTFVAFEEKHLFGSIQTVKSRSRVGHSSILAMSICASKNVFLAADFWKLAFYDVNMHISSPRGVENGEKLPRVCPPGFPVGGPGPQGSRCDPKCSKMDSKMDSSGSPKWSPKGVDEIESRIESKISPT